MKIYPRIRHNGYRYCHYEYSLYIGSDRIGSNSEKYKGADFIKRSRYTLYHWNSKEFASKNYVNYAGNENKLILKRKVAESILPFNHIYHQNMTEVSSIVRLKIPIGCSDMILIRKWE